jgi:hypothetical protein
MAIVLHGQEWSGITIATGDNPYLPTNTPAIDDLMSMFSFPPE